MSRLIICNEPARNIDTSSAGRRSLRDKERHDKLVVVFDFDIVHSLSSVFDEVSDLKFSLI